MKPILFAILSCALAGAAVGQMTIPPHASVYNGFTRGYNFVAPTSFLINQLELPLDAMQAGDTASFAVRINGTMAFHSVGTAGPSVATSIVVTVGDLVDVVGNWSPAAASTFTAHNSYGNTAPYATTILGQAVSLYRQGVQNDIGDPAWASGTQFLYAAATTAGSIGRVLMYDVPLSGTFVNFNSDVRSGASPLTVNFQDQSYTSDPGGILAWAWDFDGDSVVDSTLQNPSFVYNNCGTYDVTLTTVDAGFGSNTRTITGMIKTDGIAANFTHQVIGPFTLTFTDTSNMAATSWAWDLDGDAVVDSTSQNAAWVYPNANPVNVSLTVTRLCSAPSTITKSIVPVQSISHNVLPNNGLGTGASVYFDINVTNPAGINVTSLDVAPSIANTAFTVQMFVKASTYVGATGLAAEWVSAGTGSSAGGTTTATPSASVLFPQPLYLPYGSHGVKLWFVGVGPRYQTGSATGANTATNGDLTLTLGVSRGSTIANAWAGTDIANRWWSGTMYYTSHNINGTAGYGSFLPGCAGSLGVPHLSSNLPQLGGTMNTTINNVPMGVGIMVIGLFNITTDLSPFGAPGCNVQVSPDANSLVFGAGTSAVSSFAVPNAPALSGFLLYHQALVLDSVTNALGAVMSDAAAFQLGF